MSTNIFADSNDRVFTISDFSKGLNSHSSAYAIPSNMCVDAQNVRFNEKFRSVSKRPVMLLVVDGGSTAITGLHKYYKSDSTSALVFSTSTYLKYDNSGTAVIIKEGLTDGKRFQFLTYKDIVIGMNGYDNAQKWDLATTTTVNTDGARTASNLTADLGSAFAELNTGANLDASAYYQYKVAFYDDTTYTYSNARSNVILTGTSVRDVTLTDIPLGPTGTTARYVYRTLGNSSKANCEADTTFYKIATISDNTTRTIDDDMTDDTADDDAAPTWATVAAGTNVTPPKGSFCLIHDERLWIAGNKTYLSDFYWSDQFNPDYFEYLTDYELVRPDDGDEITFMKESRGGILTFGKTNTIQNFYTNDTDDDPTTFTEWYMSDPLSFEGCPAPYSAANTPLGIFYLGRNGIWRFNGQQSFYISDAVTPEINDISQINIEECIGVFFNNEYQLAYTSIESGASTNDRVLIYDLIRDAYTIDHKNINCFAVLSSGTDFGVLYSGDSGTDGYIYAHESTPSLLIKRYESDFDAGTFDDTRVYNTEKDPIVELAWDCTIDGWLTELQTKDANIDTIDEIVTYIEDAIIDRPDTDGTWTSPIYYIGAEALAKLYWNEDLGTYGDITWNIKTCDDSACSGDSFGSTAYTNPNGDDISSETAEDYIQLRANFSTTDIDYTPELILTDGYVFKMTYYRTGSTPETDVLSTWDSGWKNFDGTSSNKWIQAIRVHYQGTSGILTIGYKNEEEIENSFDIDLNISPLFDEDEDERYDYIGTNEHKIYTYYPPIGDDDNLSAIGNLWWFSISDEKTTTTLETDWVVEKISVIWRPEERI